MTKATRCMILEHLERRQMLTGSEWVQDTGQQLGQNSVGALGDLDGDGDLDAFLGCYSGPLFEGQCDDNSVWLNDGQGVFHRAWSARAANVLSVALADLDSDGDLDAFVGMGTPFATAANRVLLNDGHGNFSEADQRLGRGISWDIALADVDDDGDYDAIVANMVGVNGIGAGSPSRVWFNDGHGHFESGPDLAGKQSMAIAVGDLDGDGDADAYLGGGWTKPANHVLLNDGKGDFADSGQILGSRFTTSVQLGDLDADGDLDAFVANGGFGGSASNQANEVWFNDGDANFIKSDQRVGNEISTASALGDTDGDGDLDAFYVNGTHNAAAQSMRVWRNDGSGGFSSEGGEIGVPSWGFSVSLGDLNGDGTLDALVGNLNRSNEIWFNVPPLPGDANRDGIFNSTDLIQVFQAGEYEDGVPGNSTWEEGDWNRDGDFDSGDLILAFQAGSYEADAASPGSQIAAAVEWIFAEAGDAQKRRAHVA